MDWVETGRTEPAGQGTEAGTLWNGFRHLAKVRVVGRNPVFRSLESQVRGGFCPGRLPRPFRTL